MGANLSTQERERATRSLVDDALLGHDKLFKATNELATIMASGSSVDYIFEYLISLMNDPNKLAAVLDALAMLTIVKPGLPNMRFATYGPFLLQVIATWPEVTRGNAITVMNAYSKDTAFASQTLEHEKEDLFISNALLYPNLLNALLLFAPHSNSLALKTLAPYPFDTIMSFLEMDERFAYFDGLVKQGLGLELLRIKYTPWVNMVEVAYKLIKSYNNIIPVAAAQDIFDICLKYLDCGDKSSAIAVALSDCIRKNNDLQALLISQGAISRVVGHIREAKTAATATILRSLTKDNTALIYKTLTQAGISVDRLHESLQDIVMNHLNSLPATSVASARDARAPWHINPKLIPSLTNQKYHIIPGQPQDKQFVAALYKQSPVPVYDLKDVRVVSSDNLLLMFAGRIALLQRRHNNKAFKPNWEQHPKNSDEELEQRKYTMDIFYALSKPYFFDRTPNVSFMPLWHGTKPEVLDSVFTTGFANLAKTDVGFFGKGLYSTGEAEYAYRVYSAGALLVNWVAAYSTYPVIASDEEQLSEKGNFANYDAHFVPVCSPHHPRTTNYHACCPGERHQYTEMVVFESSQMLPHYIVELQPSLPCNPFSLPSCEHTSISAPDHNAASSQTNKTNQAVLPTKVVDDWDVDEVCNWASTLPLEKLYMAELKASFITGEVLKSMTKQDWQEIGVHNVGDIRALILHAGKL